MPATRFDVDSIKESIVSKLVGDISETPIASIFYNSNLLTDFIGGFIKTV